MTPRVQFKEAYNARFKSTQEGACALHAAWAKVDPEAASKIKVPSLATKVGDLLRGTKTWWEKREQLTTIFAEIFGLEATDLLGEKPLSKASLQFPEFPDLPPLTSSEEPCLSGPGDWLLRHIFRPPQQAQHIWITAPMGAGKSMTIKYLAHRQAPSVDAVTLQTLEGALPYIFSGRVLVAEVCAADAVADPEAMRRLSHRPVRAIILAPFVPERRSNWEFRTWAPEKAWRRIFIEWIEDRLDRFRPHGKFVKEHVLDWIERFDPDGALVATPGDILALCADFDTFGPDAGSFGHRAKRWLENIGTKAAPAAPEGWATLSVADVYAALAEADLKAIERRLGGRTQKQWAQLLPSTHALAVSHLQQASLLRGASDGLRLFPAWVHEGILHDWLINAAQPDAFEEWGALAADSSRQGLIDTVISRLSDSEFLSLVRRFVRSEARKSLAWVGAMEAIFASAAARLDRTEFRLKTSAIPDWQALGILQVQHLRRTYTNTQLLPWTRQDAPMKWIADGWSFSLRVPRPTGFERDDLQWELPGWWSTPHLNDSSNKIRERMYERQAPDAARRRIFNLGGDFIKLIPGREIPSNVPTILLPDLFLGWIQDGWKLTSKELDQLNETWEAEELVRRAEALPPQTRTKLADFLWALHVQSGERSQENENNVAACIFRLRSRRTTLAQFIIENISNESLERTIGNHGFWKSSSMGRTQILQLPQERRKFVLELWVRARDIEHDGMEVSDLVDLAGRDDLDFVIDLVNQAELRVAKEIIPLVWSRDVQRGLEEASIAFRHQHQTAEVWFLSAPRAALKNLVGIVRAGDQDSGWIKKWAFQRAHDGGTAAEDLFQIAEAGYNVDLER